MPYLPQYLCNVLPRVQSLNLRPLKMPRIIYNTNLSATVEARCYPKARDALGGCQVVLLFLIAYHWFREVVPVRPSYALSNARKMGSRACKCSTYFLLEMSHAEFGADI